MHDYKGICDPICTIFKMMIGEMFEKPKLQFPIDQPLLIIYLCIYN